LNLGLNVNALVDALWILAWRANEITPLLLSCNLPLAVILAILLGFVLGDLLDINLALHDLVHVFRLD
jgi:hypothetical protein